MDNCRACKKVIEAHPPQRTDDRLHIGEYLYSIGALVGLFGLSCGLMLLFIVLASSDESGLQVLSGIVFLGLIVVLLGDALVAYLLAIVLPTLVRNHWREDVRGYYLYHYLTKDGTYHCHDYDPVNTMGEAEHVALLCQVAHGGWFKKSEIRAGGQWEIRWASSFMDFRDEYSLRIQGFEFKSRYRTFLQSSMTVPAEQALRIMQKHDSVREFVEQTSQTEAALKDAIASLHERIELVHERVELVRGNFEEKCTDLELEKFRTDALAKHAIRLLNMFEEFPNTIGRTKHARALKQPLEEMLAVIDDPARLDQLRKEAADDKLVETVTSK
jgi:hypothetical protein